MKILFLAANPSSTTRLKLGEELAEIDKGLRNSNLRERFQLVQRWEVRARDLRQALLEENPDVVHFSGHGEGEAGLVIVDRAGQAKPATGEALVGLFRLFPNIKCVLLNACYAEVQAEAIVQEIDYVIGMRDTIKDDAAIAFSTGFYDGLGYGRNIEDAFELGRNAIIWEQASFSDGTRNRKMIPVDLIEEESSESLPEHLKPILLIKEGINLVNPPNNGDDTEIKSKNLEKYRDRIKEYVAEGKLNPRATFQLGTLAQELKISQVEANEIWEEELGKIEEVVTPSLQRFSFEVITVNDRGQEIKRESGQAQYFTEDLGNDITLDMVYIPRGSFMMGTEDEEIERLVKQFNWDGVRREKPQHEVTLQSFFIGKYPVTQEQWRKIASLPIVNRYLEVAPCLFTTDNLLPVESVSWEDAVEFCQRLSQYTGQKYQLPSEAQWEYSCRATTTTPFHFGETITGVLANYDLSSTYANEPTGESSHQTTPVGSFRPNAFGLYDMHGNLWEWCEDDWHHNYEGAPTDGSSWLRGDRSINAKIARGGSWGSYARSCRSASRFKNMGDNRYPDVGFRVVCVAPRQT